MDDRPPIDDLAIEAYVLGTLSREEARALEAQIAATPELQARVQTARAVTWLLAESPAPVAPSPALRARVLAAVRAERDEMAAAAPPPAEPDVPAALLRQPPAPAPLPPRTPRPRPWRTWLAATALLLALSLGTWNVLLQQQLNQQRAQLERAEAAEAALPAADRFWTMHGVPERAPAAVSTLALNLRHQQPVLIVRGFPRLGPDETYQVWVIQGNRPVPVGAFAPMSEDDAHTLVINSDLSGVTRAAITIEPRRDNLLPPGTLVMGGDL